MDRCNGPTSQHLKRQTPKEKGRSPLYGSRLLSLVGPSCHIIEGKLEVHEETRWAYLCIEGEGHDERGFGEGGDGAHVAEKPPN